MVFPQLAVQLRYLGERRGCYGDAFCVAGGLLGPEPPSTRNNWRSVGRTYVHAGAHVPSRRRRLPKRALFLSVQVRVLKDSAQRRTAPSADSMKWSLPSSMQRYRVRGVRPVRAAAVSTGSITDFVAHFSQCRRMPGLWGRRTEVSCRSTRISMCRVNFKAAPFSCRGQWRLLDSESEDVRQPISL